MIETQESITAKLCAFARAYHSSDDYLAFDFMGKEEFERIGQLIHNDFDIERNDINDSFESDKIRKKLDRYIAPIPLSRIAFAEKKLHEFSQRYPVCQYVICGAGMDTFAFRNEEQGIKIFELDHPDTGRYKRERIRELEWNIPENLIFVPIDFSKDDMAEVLKNAGFDPKLPTFFAILGVTYYLTLPVFEQTVRTISELCGDVGEIVFDYPDETTLTNSDSERINTLTAITEKLGEKMLHGYSYKEISDVLDRCGFAIDAHETPTIIQQNYFENSKMKAFKNIHFMSAKRQ